MNLYGRMVCILLAAACVAAEPATTAPTVVLSDNFDGDMNKNGAQPPSNLGVVGKWLAPSDLFISRDFRNSGALAGEVVDLPGSAQGSRGYLQTSARIGAAGTSVHATINLRYHSGADIAFGLTTNAASIHQKKDALVWLQFQHQSESYSTKLRALNSDGNLVDVGEGVHLHTGASEANPFPEGQTFDKIEFDYTVGDETAVLSINGKVVNGHVPLSSPGGAVDGMFFTVENPTGTNVVYYIDDLLIETRSSE